MAQRDRRESTRFAVRPMYTRVLVRPDGERLFTMEGHAYDISMGGMRFELDDALPTGSPIGLMLELPDTSLSSGPDGVRLVAATGTVVWTDDDGARGPVRMAAIFHAFETDEDEARLRETLSSGGFALAA